RIVRVGRSGIPSAALHEEKLIAAEVEVHRCGAVETGAGPVRVRRNTDHVIAAEIVAETEGDHLPGRDRDTGPRHAHCSFAVAPKSRRATLETIVGDDDRS